MMNAIVFDPGWREEISERAPLSDPEPAAQWPEEEVNPLLRSIHDRYHCPDDLLCLRLRDDFRLRHGYFQFGVDTTCYGHFSGPCAKSIASVQRVDATPDVAFDGAAIVMPFDPNEIIDNLRWERYPASRLRAWDKILKDLYYRIRPFTSRTIRKSVQRLRAANWHHTQFPRWPVDTTVEDICETLLTLFLQASGVEEIPFIWFWPDGARCCVTMTHDVETEAGRDLCIQLLSLDKSHAVKPSFQLVPEGRYELTPDLLQGLRDGGAEICIQDLNHDGRLFDRRSEFLRRVDRINRYGREYGARGFRSAVLYRNPEWYQDLEFDFDMSIPNVAHLDPQRGGCCTVFPYFIGEILELPLTTIQDYTLWHVLGEGSLDLWKAQFETILDRNGLASFLVHPDYVADLPSQDRYRELLSMLESYRADYPLWFAPPGEVDTWWRIRDRLRIVGGRGNWRIVGEGSERAVLAFATLSNGELIYKWPDGHQGDMKADALSEIRL